MDQILALDILKSGHNVLLTGSAGTGKTHVLGQFIEHLQSHQVQVAITASTGLAATHLGGTTIHSWAKIGIKSELPKGYIQKISEKEKKRFQATDVLIIDEISMLHDFRLDMVDLVLRGVRDNNEPFGGIQVILCGDFFQLPPVNRADERQGSFITSSEVWKESPFVVCYLDKSYRQQADAEFADILNALRSQDLRRKHADQLLARIGAQPTSRILPTKLYPTNVDTERINKKHLDLLDTEARTFQMSTHGRKDKLELLKKSCLAEEALTLKVGAQVMCIKNNPSKGYSNGTLGIIAEFSEGLLGLPVIRTTSGKKIMIGYEDWELKEDSQSKPKATISQLPLKLAWAITVHKSQGMTLDAAQMDLTKTFVRGMGYVALSRVRSLDTLFLEGLNKMALQVSPEAMEIDKALRVRSEDAVTNEKQLVDSKHLRYKLSKKAEKKPVKAPSGDFQSRIVEMRKTYPNAFKQWKPETIGELQRMFETGTTDIKKLCKHFGRQPGSITFQLQKMGLIDE